MLTSFTFVVDTRIRAAYQVPPRNSPPGTWGDWAVSTPDHKAWVTVEEFDFVRLSVPRGDGRRFYLDEGMWVIFPISEREWPAAYTDDEFQYRFKGVD